MQNDVETAAGLYVYAASLRSLGHGRAHPDTQRAAQRAVELCRRAGASDMAEKMRNSYALDRQNPGANPDH